mmetsp:Transcript_12260/g.29982  ORF Transcript_12260/g.29982 Transcript_12260/m.29982 type:complete len:415 (+) Transcript_12260:91-1335(+)
MLLVSRALLISVHGEIFLWFGAFRPVCNHALLRLFLSSSSQAGFHPAHSTLALDITDVRHLKWLPPAGLVKPGGHLLCAIIDFLQVVTCNVIQIIHVVFIAPFLLLVIRHILVPHLSLHLFELGCSIRHLLVCHSIFTLDVSVWLSHHPSISRISLGNSWRFWIQTFLATKNPLCQFCRGMFALVLDNGALPKSCFHALVVWGESQGHFECAPSFLHVAPEISLGAALPEERLRVGRLPIQHDVTVLHAASPLPRLEVAQGDVELALCPLQQDLALVHLVGRRRVDVVREAEVPQRLEVLAPGQVVQARPKVLVPHLLDRLRHVNNLPLCVEGGLVYGRVHGVPIPRDRIFLILHRLLLVIVVLLRPLGALLVLRHRVGVLERVHRGLDLGPVVRLPRLVLLAQLEPASGARHV